MKLRVGNVREEGIMGTDTTLHEVDGALGKPPVDHFPLIQIVDLYVFGRFSSTSFHHLLKLRQRTRVGAEAGTLRPERLV